MLDTHALLYYVLQTMFLPLFYGTNSTNRILDVLEEEDNFNISIRKDRNCWKYVILLPQFKYLSLFFSKAARNSTPT
jgi:hypothetical protein